MPLRVSARALSVLAGISALAVLGSLCVPPSAARAASSSDHHNHAASTVSHTSTVKAATSATPAPTVTAHKAGVPFSTIGQTLSSGPVPLESATDLTAATPSAAFALAQSTGQRVEILSRVTSGSTVYAMPDGGEAVLSHTAPIRVAQPNGGWSPVSTTLSAVTGGLTSTTQTPDGVSFGGGSSATLARAIIGDQTVGVDWTGALPIPSVKGSTATYSSVASNTDLTMTALPDGYEISLTLNAQPSTAVSYRIPLHLPADWTAATTAVGGVDLSNANGVVKQHISATLMHDAAGDVTASSAHTMSVATSLDDSGESPVLVLTPDWSFLTASSTVYPVTIDPTVEDDVDDTYAYQRYPTTNYDGAHNIDAGELTSGYVTRSYLEFPISAFHGMSVASSFLGLYMLDSDCINENVNIYLDSTLNLSTLTWNTKPTTETLEDSTHYYGGDNSATGVACSGGGPGNYAATSTHLAQAFAGMPGSDAYADIQGSNESDDTDFFQAGSRDDTDPGVTSPYIDAYVYPSAPTSLTSKYLATTSPALSASITAPGDQAITPTFYIGTSHGASDVVNGATTTAIPAGATQTATYNPSNKLRPGGKYYWYVDSCNPWGACVQSSIQSFTIDPQIGAGDQPSYQFDSHQLDDHLVAKVNEANGNLLLEETDLTLPGPTKSLTLGLDYNSLRVDSDGSNTGSPYLSPGWRYSTGADYTLSTNSDGMASVWGPSGEFGGFTPAGVVGSYNTFTAPPGWDATLKQSTSSSNWTLVYNQTGEEVDFNSSGLITADKNRDGYGFTFHYPSGVSTPDTVTSAAGPSGGYQISFTYGGPGGRLSQLSQTAGSSTRTVSLSYDSSNRLHEVTDADGGHTYFNYGYGANGLLSAVTDPNGVTTSISYGGVDISSYPYLADISPEQVSDLYEDSGGGGLDAHTNYSYTNSGSASDTQMVITDAMGNTTTAVNDPSDRITDVYDGFGVDTGHSTYNSDSQVLTFEDGNNSDGGAGQQTQNTFGANSGESLTTSEDGNGAKTRLGYGSGPTGFEATSSYNTMNPSTTTPTNSYSYGGGGSAGDLESNENQGTGNTTNLTENTDGTVSTSETPKGATTSYHYTDEQLTSIDPPSSGSSLDTVTLTYDGFGRLATETRDANDVTVGHTHSVTVTYSYDNQDRITKETFSNSDHELRFGYDADGNTTVRGDGTQTTSYYYDTLNDLTAKIATSAPPNGTAPTRATNPCPTASNTALCYIYDSERNLLSASDAGGTTTYHYNADNRVDAMQEPGGTNSIYDIGYDANGNLTKIWGNATSCTGGNCLSPHYNMTDTGPSNDLTYQIDTPGGYKTYRYTHYTNGNIDEEDAYSGSTEVQELSYTYDLTSNQVSNCAADSGITLPQHTGLRQTMVNGLTSTTTTYCYDGQSRLTWTSTNGGTTKQYNYGYDADSNITSGAAGSSHSYNNSDEISDTGYTYDGDGNLTSVTAGTTIASYNDLDNTTSYNSDSFSYAGGSQTERVTGDSLTYGNGLPGTDSQFNSAGTSGIYFEYLPNGTLISERVISSGTQSSNKDYITDANGSVTMLINDNSGTTEATYSYDPYGHQTGGTTLGGSANVNPFGFDGAYWDSTASLYKMGQRYYNPSDGRFTQPDSNEHLGDLEQGDLYSFASDDPVSNVDPSGSFTLTLTPDDEAEISILIGVGTGVAAAVQTATGVAAPIAVITAIVGSLTAGLFASLAAYQITTTISAGTEDIFIPYVHINFS